YEPPPPDALPLTNGEETVVASVRSREEGADEETAAASSFFPTKEHWLGHMKLGCMLCHQLGQEITRVWLRPTDWDAVWERAGMDGTAKRLAKEPLKKSLAAWASRIAAGEVPPAPPP